MYYITCGIVSYAAFDTFSCPAYTDVSLSLVHVCANIFPRPVFADVSLCSAYAYVSSRPAYSDLSLCPVCAVVFSRPA
jgi:hypothetical protein